MGYEIRCCRCVVLSSLVLQSPTQQRGILERNNIAATSTSLDRTKDQPQNNGRVTFSTIHTGLNMTDLLTLAGQRGQCHRPCVYHSGLQKNRFRLGVVAIRLLVWFFFLLLLLVPSRAQAVQSSRTKDQDVTPSVSHLTENRTALVPTRNTTTTTSSVTLRIVHITDVYHLDNFASLATLLDTHRVHAQTVTQQQQHQQSSSNHSRSSSSSSMHVISILTGDFLMPHLLSMVDGGRGMMRLINAVHVDYLTWGNHENDLPHHLVLERAAEFQGRAWINTNMLDHEAWQSANSKQVPYEIITLEHPHTVHDTNTTTTTTTTTSRRHRRIALLGILTNDPSVVPPGAFGGATVLDPWDTMRSYQQPQHNPDKTASSWKQQHDVDFILPLCHLYQAREDERTAAELDFDLVLGGHDHDVVHRTMNGTLFLKPGADADFATIVDLTWTTTTTTTTDPGKTSTHTTTTTRFAIDSELVRVADYAPNATIQDLVEQAYSVLKPLQETQLDRLQLLEHEDDHAINAETTRNTHHHLLPLSSKGARSQPITVANYIGNLIQLALLSSSSTGSESTDSSMTPILETTAACHAFVAKGGNFHGGRTYFEAPNGLTLQVLLGEMNPQAWLYVTAVPGSILQQALAESESGTGFWQYNDALTTTTTTNATTTTTRLTHVLGKPLDPQQLYSIATLHDFFRARDGPAIGEYFLQQQQQQQELDSTTLDPVLLYPDSTRRYPLYEVLLTYLAHKWWNVLWDHADVNGNGQLEEDNEFTKFLDVNDNGYLDQDDLKNVLLPSILGLSTHDDEPMLVEYMLQVAGTGKSIASGSSSVDHNNNSKPPTVVRDTVTSPPVSLAQLNRVRQTTPQWQTIVTELPMSAPADNRRGSHSPSSQNHQDEGGSCSAVFPNGGNSCTSTRTHQACGPSNCDSNQDNDGETSSSNNNNQTKDPPLLH